MDPLLPRDQLILGQALLIRDLVALLVGDHLALVRGERLAVGSVLHLHSWV